MLAILQFFASWFVRIFVLKIIAGIGVGLVSYSVVGNFFEDLKGHFISSFYSLPTIIISLLEIGGFVQGMNIFFSGISFLVGFYSVEYSLRIIK